VGVVTKRLLVVLVHLGREVLCAGATESLSTHRHYLKPLVTYTKKVLPPTLGK
jgi:hypothetical protein